MLKLHLILSLTYITFTISLLPNLDYSTTEPYVEFDWLDEDKKKLTIGFKDGYPSAEIKCCLYNGTNLCESNNKCTKGTKSLTCEFEGDKCKADGDNPAVKYYYALYCDDTNCAEDKVSNLGNYDVEVTVAVLNSGFIKVWLTFIFCLLVF